MKLPICKIFPPIFPLVLPFVFTSLVLFIAKNISIVKVKLVTSERDVI